MGLWSRVKRNGSQTSLFRKYLENFKFPSTALLQLFIKNPELLKALDFLFQSIFLFLVVYGCFNEGCVEFF